MALIITMLEATAGHPWRDPQWLQALAALVPALAGAIGGLVAALPQRRANRRIEAKAERARQAAEDAHYAITNDHSQPLREDLDAQFSALAEDQRQTRLAVGQVAESQRMFEVTIGEALIGLKQSLSSDIERLADRSKEEEAKIRHDGARIAAEVESRLGVLESRRCRSCDAGAADSTGEEP